MRAGLHLVVEADPLPVVPATGVADRENFFAAIAWPTAADQGTKVYLLMPDGTVRLAPFDGKAPDVSKAVIYDPVKSTWTSPWPVLPPRLPTQNP